MTKKKSIISYGSFRHHNFSASKHFTKHCIHLNNKIRLQLSLLPKYLRYLLVELYRTYLNFAQKQIYHFYNNNKIEKNNKKCKQYNLHPHEAINIIWVYLYRQLHQPIKLQIAIQCLLKRINQSHIQIPQNLNIIQDLLQQYMFKKTQIKQKLQYNYNKILKQISYSNNNNNKNILLKQYQNNIISLDKQIFILLIIALIQKNNQQQNVIIIMQQCYPILIYKKSYLLSMLGNQIYYKKIKQFYLYKKYQFNTSTYNENFIICHKCSKLITQKYRCCASSITQRQSVLSANPKLYQTIIINANYSNIQQEIQNSLNCYKLSYLEYYSNGYEQYCCNRYYCSECSCELNNDSNNNIYNMICQFCTQKCSCEKCRKIIKLFKILAYYSIQGGNLEDISVKMISMKNNCIMKGLIRMGWKDQLNINQFSSINIQNQLQYNLSSVGKVDKIRGLSMHAFLKGQLLSDHRKKTLKSYRYVKPKFEEFYVNMRQYKKQRPMHQEIQSLIKQGVLLDSRIMQEYGWNDKWSTIGYQRKRIGKNKIKANISVVEVSIGENGIEKEQEQDNLILLEKIRNFQKTPRKQSKSLTERTKRIIRSQVTPQISQRFLNKKQQ